MTSTSVADVEKIRAGLAAVVDLDGGQDENWVGQLVAIYLGTHPKHAVFFAGRHFTSLGPNPQDQFDPADLLALALLDVPVSWKAVVEILVQDNAHQYAQLLADIPDDVDLWDCRDQQLEAVTQLWQRLRAIGGIGWVRAHKLIARKRPRVHPVYDQVVRTWFQQPGGVRYGLREVLGDQGLRGELADRLTPPPPSPDELPLIRLIDIAVWMLGSRSKAAQQARTAVGVTPPTDRVEALT